MTGRRCCWTAHWEMSQEIQRDSENRLLQMFHSSWIDFVQFKEIYFTALGTGHWARMIVFSKKMNIW